MKVSLKLSGTLLEMTITKKQFMKTAGEMEKPFLKDGYDSRYPFLNIWFILLDENDIRKKLQLDACRLSSSEYDAGKIDKYLERAEKLAKKYDRWLEEAKKKKSE